MLTSDVCHISSTTHGEGFVHRVLFICWTSSWKAVNTTFIVLGLAQKEIELAIIVLVVDVPSTRPLIGLYDIVRSSPGLFQLKKYWPILRFRILVYFVNIDNHLLFNWHITKYFLSMLLQIQYYYRYKLNNKHSYRSLSFLLKSCYLEKTVNDSFYLNFRPTFGFE